VEIILILNALIFIGLAIASIIYGNYLKNYMNRKGQNLADKEDIKSITTLVEGVKRDFTRETELLKSHLSVESGHKLNLLDEEKAAIINLNKSYFRWFNLNRNILSTKNSEVINEYLSRVNSSATDMNDSETAFKLFINDTELLSLYFKMVSLTWQQVVPLHFDTLTGLKDGLHRLKYCTKQEQSDEIYLEQRRLGKYFFDNCSITSELAEAQNDFIKNCSEFLYKIKKPQSHQ
jgi:hypothetical protein